MSASNPYASAATRSAAPAPTDSGQRAEKAGPDGVFGTHVMTGEAVALELSPAGTLSRMMSGLIDVLVAASVAGGVAVILVGTSANQAQLQVGMILAIVTLVVIVPTTVETITRGRSAGKLAVGLRIVRDDGGPVRFRHALIRSLASMIEVYLTLGSVAIITSMINSRGKRLGDIFAGTYSLRVREAEISPAPLLMPQELRAWAQIADIRRLPDSLALHARTHLSRTGEVSPQLREQIGRRFAATLEQYVSPPPPWGTNPERFMAAVLVARRDREYIAGTQAAGREQSAADQARALPFSIADAP